MQKIPLNEQYLTQCEIDPFSLAQQALAMASAVITYPIASEVREQALSIIATYADWQQMADLPAGVKRTLLTRRYGEEEVREMEGTGLICACCSNAIPSEHRKRYPHENAPGRFLCETCKNTPCAPDHWLL
jgi:hypothetical protein